MDYRNSRGDRSSRGESSSRGNRFDRGRQNQREGETLEQQTQRLDRERTEFLQTASRWDPSDRKSKTDWYVNRYVESEKRISGLKGLNLDDMNEHHKKAMAKISNEIEYIVTGRKSLSDDKVNQLTNQMQEFNEIVESLGKDKINVFSNKWIEFRQEAYDNIIEKYKLDQRDARVIMLADILQVESTNKCSIEQRKSKEYKTVVRIVVSEWEAWQQNN